MVAKDGCMVAKDACVAHCLTSYIANTDFLSSVESAVNLSLSSVDI